MKPFLISCAVILALFLAGKLVAMPRLDEWRLNNVESFEGLDRTGAYARLRSLGLTPAHVALYDADGYPQPDGDTWPRSGDVVVKFPNASRNAPYGACGAWAIAAIHFGGAGRVVRVTERVRALACL